METIFGAEMPIAAKVLLALLIVIGLAGGFFYVARYVSASRFGAAALRGRQPRLAVIEVAGVDPRRRLVLIRRDNVEHLLMIGGPTDVVVEPNILRAVAVGASREAPQARSGSEPSRTPAMADATLWPLQPEPAPRPQRQIAQAPQPAPPAALPPQAAPEEPAAWPLQPQSEPAAARTHAVDHLAGLAAELGRAPAQADRAPAENAAPAREPKRTIAQIAPAPQSTATDQNLTEMAQRLEAALRHSPGARGADAPPAKPEPATPARTNGTAAAPEPPRVVTSELRAVRPDAKPTPPKALYDSLEQEMASLLGRPAGKT
jgi:flagellar biogenesis protein FliO